MKRCKTLWMRVCLLVAALCLGAVVHAAEFAKASYVLAHHFNPGQPSAWYGDRFAELVKEMTGGNVVIEVLGASQIGGLKDNADALRYGTLDFSLIDLPTIATIVPKASIISLPYVFNNLEHAEKFYGTEESDKLDREILDVTGIRFLGHSHVGLRVVIGQFPVNKPEDLNNLKISSPDKPINVQTMKAFGANPTVVPFGETYTALQTGIINAGDLTPDSSYGVKLHEVCKYISGTDHIYVDLCLAVSDSLYNTLDPELQKVILKAAEIATAEHRKLTANAYEEYMAKSLAENQQMQRITPPSLEPFREAVQVVWEQFSSDVADGRAIIDYIRSIQ